MTLAKKHSKPLFHKKTLDRAVDVFAFPADMDRRLEIVRKWIATLESGVLDEIKEVSLHGKFLGDIFENVLDYTSVVASMGKAWTLSAEQSVADGGGTADGAVGFFTSSTQAYGGLKLHGRIVAPIELKGAKTDLDRPQGSRHETPVEQGWRYANYTEGCRWVIVSNYKELRLYNLGKTPAFSERFLLAELADREQFRRFFFLLCAGNFLPASDAAGSRSAVDDLLKRSDSAEEQITKTLYEEYKKLRYKIVEHLRNQRKRGAAGLADLKIVEAAQKILDRILFIAFCEDKGLIPANTLQKAHDFNDPYAPSSAWTRFKAVFRWVDQGNEHPPIPGYNGGLFQHDKTIDELIDLPAYICAEIKNLVRYDYDSDVSVEVLGHIFEQSITDLEEMKAELTGAPFNKKQGKRKMTGVYYTPAFITQHMADLALGGYLRRREQTLRQAMGVEAIPPDGTAKERTALAAFWRAYRDDVLRKTRVVDPACGSGAFLIAVFDLLVREYERANANLAALIGEGTGEFLVHEVILSENLFGVDLSPESVEITKLSLWLKTAEKGKKLTFLDRNIRHGNSIIAAPEADQAAFDWRKAFPEVFGDGGFDVVIGNPPYVRQELLTPIKPYLKEHYKAFDGAADIYVYFYERGLSILKPGGLLSYIVTNKWLKAGYGEGLRAFFAEHAILESIVDFGHAPIFEDADVFPCIVLARKPVPAAETKAGTQAAGEHGAAAQAAGGQTQGAAAGQEPDGQGQAQEPPKHEPQAEVAVCPVPREALPGLNLKQYCAEKSFAVPWSRFGREPWSLEPPAVEALMRKIRERGVPLKDYLGVKPYRGILTGFNEAFLIDQATRDRLVAEDAKSAEIIKPYLRGQDIKRWVPEWAGLWMIFARRGIDIDAYPAVKRHLEQFRPQLEPKPGDWDAKRDGKWLGRKPGHYQWYEIQDAIDYWKFFEQSKIVHTDITWNSQFAYCPESYYLLNTAYMWPTNDTYVLSILNSPLLWAYMWRNAQHGKDDALRLIYSFVENIPIAEPVNDTKEQIHNRAERLCAMNQTNYTKINAVYSWLHHEHDIDKLNARLKDFASLSRDDFIKELKSHLPKGRRGLNPAALKQALEVYGDYALPIQSRRAEIDRLEREVSSLVFRAYGLTYDEIELLWRTAPPRMPLAPHNPLADSGAKA